MKFNAVHYEPGSLAYSLGEQFQEIPKNLPWAPIDSHNSIKEVQEKPNSELGKTKRNLIVGIWKTHKYVGNQKVSGYLVSYTSSGYTVTRLYYYLVCNCNKYTYLRLFVDREQMLDRTIKRDQKSEIPLTFEIGSSSDLVLESTITNNLLYTIPRLAREGTGSITFPAKFHMVDPLLDLPHRGRTVFRMSVNSQSIISKIELGTSSLSKRIEAMNKMCETGYPCGLLIAPVILTENWKMLYAGLPEELQDGLVGEARNQVFLEIILITYSYIRRAISNETFPNAPELYNTEQMTGGGRGRYCYRPEVGAEVEIYLRGEIRRVLGDMRVLYIG